MSKHRSREEWAAIIEAAAKSGLKVSDFCRQNNISKNLFYRNSLRLGYTSEGIRTEKWIAAASAESVDHSLPEYPTLVPVPVQTVQMAWRPAGFSHGQSQISILHDSFRIVVEDGFSQDTLRGVLEVIINAGCLDHFRKRVVSALRAIPNLKQMTEEEKLGIPAYVIMLKLNEVFRLERKTKKLATKEERDTYRNGLVRNAFEDLVQTTLGIDITACPAKSYTYDAIRYMQNQEVFLDQFLEDGNIASNHSKCERKFAFFAILRNQIKMFGSIHSLKPP